MEDPNGNFVPQNEMMNFILDAENKKYLLKSGYSGYFAFTTSIDHVNPNQLYDGEEMFVEFNFATTLPFEQITE